MIVYDCLWKTIHGFIAWLKFLYGLLSIFPLILFVNGTQSPFSICPYKTPGGNSWYFRTGVCHYKISISTLSGIFDEKVGPFSEFLCLMEVSKVWFWGLFWEKMASIFKKFSKNCGFFVQTRSNKSINSVFFWFVICVIKITVPIWNFLQIL